MNSIQISITQLRNLLEVAELQQSKNDSDCSGIVKMIVEKENDAHLGTDKLRFELNSKYAECNGTFLGTN